jgi:hypothetical protein
MWWRAVSFVMAVAAIVGVFVYIPIVSDYAFWFLVVAIIIWLGVHALKVAFSLAAMLSIVLLLVAIVSVFPIRPVPALLAGLPQEKWLSQTQYGATL